MLRCASSLVIAAYGKCLEIRYLLDTPQSFCLYVKEVRPAFSTASCKQTGPFPGGRKDEFSP
jgi:hypothetical protein